MQFDLDDTIAALASPPGPAARGILRVSGSETRRVLDELFEPDEPRRWQSARRAARHPGHVRLDEAGPPVPAAVHLWPTRRSYTGQPMAEVHTIGSPPLLEAILGNLHARGARPARAGEFTLRAFLAGRIDLTQAEAVLGVIDADDHAELATALKQLAGGVSGRIGEVRGDLLNLLADLEAGLDFVEDDIEFIAPEQLCNRLSASRDGLNALLDQAAERMQSTGRRRVVLAGLPNAGKSTLFNALLQTDAALVSEVQGTTRDYLAAQLDWNGLALELIDTAGWESAAEEIMQQAQHLRGEQLDRADLIVWCTPADADRSLREADARLVADLHQQGRPVLAVQTRVDLAATSQDAMVFGVSAPNGRGLDELLNRIGDFLTDRTRGGRQLLGTTAARCRDSLENAIRALDEARRAAEAGLGEELVAIEVRDALDHLGRILGEVYTDDILDRIFSRFCIGK